MTVRHLSWTLICLVSICLAGCGYVFPGFEGPFGIHSYIHDMPIARITTELQCELKDFLQSSPYAVNLDPDQAATVSLKLEADQSGQFQYVGIDLSKVGLPGLAALIAPSSKTPSLQAKLQEKTATLAQIDMSIPQAIETHYLKRKLVVNPDTGKIEPAPKVQIKGLDHVSCDPALRLITPLALSGWLDRFFAKQESDQPFFGTNTEPVCMSKITLSTQIAIIGDLSAGVNPLISTVFILPVTGESFDFSPSAIQTLNIVFSLKQYKTNDLCAKLPQPQPQRTLSPSREGSAGI